MRLKGVTQKDKKTGLKKARQEIELFDHFWTPQKPRFPLFSLYVAKKR